MARVSRSKTPKPELEVTPEPMVIPPAPPIVEPAPVEQQADVPPAVGDQLRRERERRGISIEAVAQMLKIRRVYLKAIEDSNWDELPEPVYVSGFIRSYANFLGLNVQHPIPAAKTEIINLPSLPKLEIPKPIDDQQLPSASTIIFAVLGLFFLYAVWTAIHSDTDKTAAQPLPAAPAEQSNADTSTATPTPTLLNEPALVQSSEPAAAEAKAPVTVADAPQATPAPAESRPSESTPTVYGSPNPTRATITASEDSWVEIQTAKKETVFSGVLRTGDSYRVPDDNNLLFSSTNLSGLKFELDGAVALPPKDAENTVTQPLSLSPDHFLKTTTATPKPLVAAAPKPATHPHVIAQKPKTAPSQTAQPDDAEDSTSDFPDDNQ